MFSIIVGIIDYLYVLKVRFDFYCLSSFQIIASFTFRLYRHNTIRRSLTCGSLRHSDGSSSSIWWFERFDGLSETCSWIFVASFWLKAILETSRVSILPLGTLQINPKFRNHCSVYFGRCWFLMCWSESRLFKISRHILRFPIFCISRGVRQGLIFRFELMSCRSLQGLRWADISRLSEANHHGGKIVDKMTLDCQFSAAAPSMKFSRSPSQEN